MRLATLQARGWRASGLALIMSVLTPVFSAPASAQMGTTISKVGSWTVSGQVGPTGYAHCTAMSLFANQPAFGFGITNAGRTVLVLAHANFRALPLGARATVDAKVGDLPSVNLTGVSSGTGTILFMYPHQSDEPALSMFASAGQVRFTGPKSNYRFDLENVAPVVDAVALCHDKKGEIPGGTRPVPPPGLYSGTGVIVSDRGDVLTNAHVVRACATIEVGTRVYDLRSATLMASDDRNDLAVLRATLPNATPVRLRADRPVRPGEDVVALGYPFSGLLAQEANVSRGSVTALAGMGDDPRFLQISAPIQPGNSGGPLFDSAGALIGLTTGMINAAAMLQLTGAVPQNIGFAIKATLLRDFLVQHAVPVVSAKAEAKMSPEDVGERGRRSTLLVRCKR